MNNGSHIPRCRFCGSPLTHTFVDLGMSPLCESYLTEGELNEKESFYPLHVYVCDSCYLVQLQEYVPPDQIFTEYAYFSSFSDTWLEHAKNYMKQMIGQFHLDKSSLVVEVASNDGYLLQYFKEAGVPILGIEPAANVAAAAQQKEIPTLVEFFGVQTARELADNGMSADLLIGNNVLAQVPDINDFVEGLKIILKPHGVITIEFPHLKRLMEGNQFDTIYHEHFSYFSLLSTEKIFSHHGLKIFDVEELPTHGGSLRIYATHFENGGMMANGRVSRLRSVEEKNGFLTLEPYRAFADQVEKTKRALLSFLINAKQKGATIVGYGAPGKGNTLLNYCGIRSDFLDYTVDRNPYKQGRYLPGTHIPIYDPSRIDETHPDYLFILPWNFKEEIMKQMDHIRSWGGKFIVPIPEVRVYS